VSIPDVIEPQKLDDYLEIMTRAVFQAGVSWALVDKKWAAFRKAFADFDVERVSRFDEDDMKRLCEDEGILRSKKKIQATVENAQIMRELDKEHGSFSAYLHSFASYEALSNDIRRRFRFVGELSVYYMLFRVGEPVPPFDAWVRTIPGDHPRMREMVEQAERAKKP
jgi:3-methyladenine DNA glycosylase Tag